MFARIDKTIAPRRLKIEGSMPANLPPQYHKVDEEYRAATTPEARLEKAREMFRLLPKHKGTEKLQADLKKLISRLRDDVEGGKGAGKKKGVSYRVPSEGAGQVVLVGAPNTGKSSILAALTKATPRIEAYPYTTREPQPGMMHWLDVRLQLVDLPPISADLMEPFVPSLIAAADSAFLVIDCGDDATLEQTEVVLDRLSKNFVELVAEVPEDNEDERVHFLRTAIVANKIDAPGGDDRLEIVRDFLGSRFPIVAASAIARSGLDDVARSAYDLLRVFRVYTKTPGKPADRTSPFTLPIGSTVLDLAGTIHRDFEKTLKFARVWGAGVFEGQSVKRDHVLSDGDLVELHHS